MAGFRKHIWYKLLDEEGVPVSGAAVYIYKYNKPGIGTEINLFTYSGWLLNQPIYTDGNGVFEFYVKDDILSKNYGVGWSDQIIISWNDGAGKSGIIRGDHIFGEYKQANTLSPITSATDYTSKLNKAISNYLGYLIDNHVDSFFGSIHGCGSSSSSSSSSTSTADSSSSSSDSSAWPT